MARIDLDRVCLQLPDPTALASLFRSCHPFRPRMVLHDIDLRIADGERVGVVGPNGAGKSALLRLLAGRHRPHSGRCEVAGRVTLLADPCEALDPEATGRENARRLAGVSAEAVLGYSELGRFADLPVRCYSAGMRWRLGFAVATAAEADVLLVDTTLGGDLGFAGRAEARLRDLVERSGIAVLAGYDADALAPLCTRVVRIEHGRLCPGELCARA